MEKETLNVQQYVEKKQNGTDYSVIRNELETKGYSNDEISNLIREVDKIILEGHSKTDSENKGGSIKLIGYLLMGIGGFLIVGTYLDWINLHGKYALMGTPLLIGYILVIISRVMGKKRIKS